MRTPAFLKKVSKPLLRPIWARASNRIEHRLQPVKSAIDDLSRRLGTAELETNHVPVLDRRLAALELPGLEHRLTTLENGWRQHLPGLLNGMSSVAALGYELASLRREMSSVPALADELASLRLEMSPVPVLADDLASLRLKQTRSAELLSADAKNLWGASEQTSKNIGELWQRIEFVRKEVMYELKYGTSNSKANVTTRILSPEKVDKAKAAGVRLNLGCGHIPLDGYINVDQRELPGVDIVGDLGSLPFEEGSLAEIFSAHVLEHFPQERLRRLLPYWRSLLRPHGAFAAIVPDGEAMLAGVAEGSYSFEHLREVLFGAQEYDGDFHFNLLTPNSFTKLLEEAGFDGIKVPVKGRKNDICFEFKVVAIKE